LFVNCEGVTPGEYKTAGLDLKIEYGFHATPFGECLLATTDRGICALDFVERPGKNFGLGDLRARWENASFIENHDRTSLLVKKIFSRPNDRPSAPFHVFLKGTNFQIKVWEALLKIPFAHVVSYEDIAEYIGRPKAVRAVANAIGSNPVPFLIPCHRVIRKVADWGGYASGTSRKKAIIGWEASYRDTVIS